MADDEREDIDDLDDLDDIDDVDEPVDDGDEAEPEKVTPEVMSGDAAAAESTAPPIPGPNEPVTLYRMVRIGITALMLIGALTTLLGVTTVLNPDSVVCAAARSNIDDAIDAGDAAPESVAGLDHDEVDDMSCDDAVALAQGLDDDLIKESTARNLGIAASVVGALMVSGGVVALMTRTRRGRTIALVTAGIGLVASMAQLGLGFISLILLAFAIFGMVFSRDAKASYGDPRAGRPAPTGGAGLGGLFRPRVPPPPKD